MTLTHLVLPKLPLVAEQQAVNYGHRAVPPGLAPRGGLQQRGDQRPVQGQAVVPSLWHRREHGTPGKYQGGKSGLHMETTGELNDRAPQPKAGELFAFNCWGFEPVAYLSLCRTATFWRYRAVLHAARFSVPFVVSISEIIPIWMSTYRTCLISLQLRLLTLHPVMANCVWRIC